MTMFPASDMFASCLSGLLLDSILFIDKIFMFMALFVALFYMLPLARANF